MCGIAGYIPPEGLYPDPALLARMCDAIAHRGPDAYGSFLDPTVALGHRRLSIIDLEGGAQPLANEDGSIQTIFNGEIYNYRELRADLAARGHRFATDSDTEVLVHLWEEEGEHMPERLNGMFAFAVWDSNRRSLFLARDRFGKKPLYYTGPGPWGRFAFASELKALRPLPGFAPATDPQAVSDFLALGYIPDPRTIYRGVHKLPPGSSLLWQTGARPRLRRYWQLLFDPAPNLTFDSQTARIRAIAADAVACRLMSDVPLGAFLSGGLDSSIVVSLMSAAVPDPIRSFSIGFTSKNYDELEYARHLATRLGTLHQEETVTPEILDTIDTLTAHYDEPFGDSSAIPTLYLARMTRQHVTVALSGDGGDEIFGGYERYLLALGHQRVARFVPEWARRPIFGGAAALYPKLDSLPRALRLKPMLEALSQSLAGAYFTLVSAFRDRALNRILSEEMRWKLGGYSTRTWFEGLFAEHAHLGPLEQMQAVDLQTYLPGGILVKVDRATMAHSLESRAPLLDYRLADAAARLPSRFKVNGLTEGKHILRAAFRDALPPVTAARRKQGFSVPMAEWMRTSLRGLFETAVFSEEMSPYISIHEARRIWNQHQSGYRNHAGRLWYLLMLGCWAAREEGRPIHAELSAGGSSLSRSRR
ncbi:MAG: asparagine synthase (glutamine-hydrolyzing) [Bryobacteraceae bacterium]